MTEAPATMEAPATIEEAKKAWRVFIAEAEKKKKPGPKKGSKKRKKGASRAIESESGGEALYTCSECNKNWPREAFYEDKTTLDGIRYVCIACCSEQAKCERETPRGIIRTLCGNAISNSQARAKQEGKEKMPEQCEIPAKTKEQIPWFQKKADESIGYTDDNTRLIHRDFQSGTFSGEGDADFVQGTGSPAQWTPEKFALVPELRKPDVPTLPVDLWARASQPQASDVSSGDEEDALRQRLTWAIWNARGHTRRLNRTATNKLCAVTINEAYLVQLFTEQCGRCQYTGVPLKINGDFKFSVERYDNAVGYRPGNVCLVIVEVNTACAKWSKAKADMYWP